MEKLEVLMFEVKMKMKLKGITQQDIADAVGVSIVTVNHVLNLKSGTVDTIRKIINFVDNK